MAIKTFTSGEVLTASDTNTYLANSGLTYITSASITTASASISVSNCFTSEYHNYRIVIDSINLSPNPCNLFMRMRDSGGDYTAAFQYYAYRGLGANGVSYDSANTLQTLMYLGVVSTFNDKMASLSLDLYNPQTASIRTYGTLNVTGYDGNFYTRNGNIIADNTSQFTGFSLLTDVAGTPIDGLQVKVYGYRKP